MGGEKEIEITLELYRLKYAVVDRHEREFYLPFAVVGISRGVEIFPLFGKNVCASQQECELVCVFIFCFYL